MNDIEPIHEIPADELQNIFDATREQLNTLYTHPRMKPEKTQGMIERQVDLNLNVLAQAILKSLVTFYPEKNKELLETIDASEAWWLQHSLEEGSIIPIPLYDGTTALLKVYLLLESYQTDYRPEDADAVLSDFSDMEQVVKRYITAAIEPTIRIARTFKETQKRKAKQPRTRNGMSPEDRKKRNEEIKKHFKKASGQGKMTPNGFAQKYTKKYAISPSQIREIINS